MHCHWVSQPQLRQSISFTSPMWDASPTSSLLLPLLGIYSSQTETFSPLRVSMQKLTQRDADTHSQWTELGDSYGRVGGRIAGTEGDKNSIGRPIESANLDPWGLQRLPSTKEHRWTGPRPLCSYIADV
ncbi:uncharacterized protein LOC110307580 [Mus caroli]|uniref:Uncharacterized protein LOC110307580 n=1 Tax=Mus caroli TaxID=10089 RepID=A0A6P5QXU4_MUSCR|nr:uncharacterized protein LOC110307580 [Mus caroli]